MTGPCQNCWPRLCQILGFSLQLLGIMLVAPETSLAQARASEPIRLDVSRSYTDTLQRGESRVFRLDVPTSGTWRVVAEKQGIDFLLLVRNPEGEEIGRLGSPIYRMGSLRWTQSLTDIGPYTIELRAPRDTAPAGELTLRADELSGEDARRRAAELAVTRALGRLPTDVPGVRRAAVRDLRQALDLWRELGDMSREGETLYVLSRLHHKLDDGLRTSIELLQQTAVVAGQVGNTLLQAAALADLGLGYRSLGELKRAEEPLERAVELFDSIDDPLNRGVTLNTLCMIDHSRGDLRGALGCYRRALSMIRETGFGYFEAALLNNLGYAYDCLGEPSMSLEHYQLALEIRRQNGNRAGEAQVLNNMAAVVFRGQGDGENALEFYDQARKIYAELEDRRQLATIINNQAETYRKLGNPERALVFFQQALDLQRQLDAARSRAVTLNGLGLTYRELGQLELAKEAHTEALSLSRQIERRRDEGLALAYLGRLAIEVGEVADGLRQLDEAVTVLGQTEELFHTARAWHFRAVGFLQAGDVSGAESSLQNALELRRRVGDRVGEADSLQIQAKALRQQGDLDGAIARARDALELVEEAQNRILGPEIRMSFLATHASSFELMIDLLMEKHLRQPGAGFDELALEISERARARTLSELLREPFLPSETSAAVGVEVAARERRTRLRRRLDAKANRLIKLRGAGRLDAPETRSLETDLEAILSELDLVEHDLRQQGHDPNKDGSLGEGGSVDVGQIQRVLGAETVLLEYALGEDRSFLWAVTDEGVEVHVLPARETIESAARQLHQAWAHLDRRSTSQDRELAMGLSRQLLSPVIHLLHKRRVAVVADGVLHNLSFAALPIPDASGQLLLEASEVVHMPSISILIRQRQRFGKRPAAASSLAMFADPVFSIHDPRGNTGLSASVAPGASPVAAELASEQSADVLRFARQAGLEALNRLPSTRREAKEIAAIAPPGNVWLALDREASRQAAQSGLLRDYQVLHFATHGLVSDDRPELSGLALSMVDSTGSPVDGLLRLRDIYDLELSAELVVLSGCRTALGKRVRGEGPVGLARGFLSAGAKRVIASLWWVQDRATADLMIRFYRALWQDALSPSAALRQAQLIALANPQSADPFHWAAFVHQGDWE